MLYFCAVICLFRLNIVSSFGMNKGADVSHPPFFSQLGTCKHSLLKSIKALCKFLKTLNNKYVYLFK